MNNQQAITLEDLAGWIREAHREAQGAFAHALDRAMAAGELLIEAKARLGHGTWLPWLQGACAIPERTAQAYMRLARNREQLKSATVADLGVRDALALLTEPKSPDDSATASALPIIPRAPMTFSEARTATDHAAQALLRAQDSAGCVAQRTHHVVTAGVPLERWCADIGIPVSEGYRYLGMWTAHGTAVLAGRWEDVPSFWDAGEVIGTKASQ